MRLSRIAATIMLALLAMPAAHAQFDKTDPQHEIEIGRQAARAVEAKTPLSKNMAMHDRVTRIGESLAAAMEHRAYPFEFKVIADPEFNAFCLPGGFMYVNEGLLTRLTDDNALAFVMGHEMTHAAHRHYAKAMRKASAEMVVGLAADIATGTDLGSRIVEMRSIAYSRSEEADADAGGLQLAYDAGYDPNGALVAARVMIELESRGPRVPDYLRDHPAGKDRYVALEAEGDALKKAGHKHVDLAPVDAVAQVANLVGAVPVAHTGDAPYFPLAVGDEWTYRVAGKDGASSTYTIRVTDALTTPEGNVTYRMQTELSGAGIVPFFWCANATGVWRKNRPADSASVWKTAYLFAPDPEDQSQPIDGSTFESLPPETVALPCGTFADTLKLRRKDARYTVECLFGRGVGLLQTTCAETGITETLVSYKRGATVAPPALQ